MSMKKYYEKIWQRLSKYSVMFLWMIAFAFVMIFCMTGIIVGYTCVKNNTDSIIEDFNCNLMREKVRYTDERVENIISCARNISNIENFGNIIKCGSSPDTLQRYQIGKFCKDMALITINGIMESQRFVYIPDINAVIGNGRVNSCEDYYKINIGGSDYNGWFENIICSEAILNYDEQNERIYFRVPAERSDAIVFVAVSKTDLVNSADNDENNDFIICGDGNKQIFSVSGKDYSPMLKDLNFTYEANKTIIKNMAVSYQGILGRDWQYVAVSDLKKNILSLTRARAVMIICALIGMLVSLLTGFLFAKKNNNDIYEIYKQMGGLDDNKTKNEYLYIKESMLGLIKQNRFKDNLINDKNRQLVMKLLRELAVGEDSFEKIRNELKSCGVLLNYKYAAIAEVSIYDCESLFYEQISDIEENYALSKIIIGNVFSDISQGYSQLYTADNGKKNLLLIFMYDNKDTILKIKESVKVGREIIRDAFNVVLKIYLSGEHKADSELRECYKDIMRLREYRTDYDKWVVDTNGSHGEGLRLQSYYLPIESERKIKKSVRIGDAAVIKESINEVFDINIDRGTPLGLMRALTMNISNIIVKNANIANQHLDEFYIGFGNFYDKIAKNVTEEQLRSEIKLFAGFVCSLSDKDENESKSMLTEEIKEYVAENYNDRNLNVNSIAFKFDLKPSVLSSFFKQHEGLGLLEYINGVRVEAASKLIKNTDKSIGEIWNETGFSNERTFYRVFEKYTGKNTSDFRKK